VKIIEDKKIIGIIEPGEYKGNEEKTILNRAKKEMRMEWW
jgi:hypothetical protein